jgi:hypothetical protein
MIGSALLFSPCMVEGQTSVSAYFPQARWYDFWTGKESKGYAKTYQTLDVPLDYIPIHIRGGSILPTQVPSLTSSETRLNAFTLTVALDSNGKAQGQLYYDDGEDLNIGNSAYFVSYSVSNGLLTTLVSQSNYAPADSLQLDKIVVLGLSSLSSSVSLNGESTAHYSWDAQSGILTVEARIGLTELKSLAWSTSSVI